MEVLQRHSSRKIAPRNVRKRTDRPGNAIFILEAPSLLKQERAMKRSVKRSRHSLQDDLSGNGSPRGSASDCRKASTANAFEHGDRSRSSLRQHSGRSQSIGYAEDTSQLGLPDVLGWVSGRLQLFRRPDKSQRRTSPTRVRFEAQSPSEQFNDRGHAQM